MSIINKVGLEAEYLLRDAKGNLVYPADHGLGADSFPIIGEFRGKPGKTRADAIGNFLKAYYEVIFRAKKEKLTIDLKGWASVSPEFHAKAMRKMETKEVAQCQNIGDVDILARTDDEVVRGKIVKKRISAGLHVHFSAHEVQTGALIGQYDLDTLLKNGKDKLDVYSRLSANIKDSKSAVKASRLSQPAIVEIVKGMDKALLPLFVKGLPALKYRLPGFYELKDHGIEYRSLPFTQIVLDKIDEITDQAFTLLEALEPKLPVEPEDEDDDEIDDEDENPCDKFGDES